MKNWVAFLLIAIGTGCGKKPESATPKPGMYEFLRQIDKLPDSDPDEIRLETYLTARKLKWSLAIGASGSTYCMSAYKPPRFDTDPHSYHVECTHFMKEMADRMIADYEQSKPGYFEETSQQMRSGGAQ